MKIGTQVSVFALALALSAAPALAQDATDTMTAPDPAVTDPALTEPAPVPEAPEGSDVPVVDVESGAATPTETLADTGFDGMTAADVIGMSVINADGETIGDINDVVLDQDQKAVYAVLSVGGFLGMGEKYVAIPFDQLQIGEDEATLLSSVTEEQLSEMAAYAEDAYADAAPDQPLADWPTDQETATDLDTAPAEVAPAEDMTAEDMAEAPAADVTAEQPADETLAEGEQPAVEETIDTTAAETDQLDAQEPAAGETTDVAPAEETMAEGEPATDESTVARQSPFADMTAEDLLGKTVVNTAGEEIGEITDLVISDDKAVQAVIGVGGFLGIGEKDVAVPLDDLQVGEDEAVLMSGLTKEALEELPAYEKDAWPSLESGQPVYQQ